jgi:hypothetical protein
MYTRHENATLKKSFEDIEHLFLSQHTIDALIKKNNYYYMNKI